MFSQTKDVTSENPARALRIDGYDSIALFCTQEPDYEGSLPMTVRALITFNTREKLSLFPVYLNGAEKLRRDLFL